MQRPLLLTFLCEGAAQTDLPGYAQGEDAFMRLTLDRVVSVRLACAMICLQIGIGHAQAPSFDCRKARYPDEFAICQTPQLAELDGVIGEGYSYLKGRYGRAYADQVGIPFWRLRQSCQSDASCIRQTQIRAIQAYQAAGAPVVLPYWAASNPTSPPPSETAPSPAAPSQSSENRTLQTSSPNSVTASVGSGSALSQDFFSDVVRDGEMIIASATNGCNYDGCAWVQIEGKLPSTAGTAFERYLAASGARGGAIYLDSPGGSLEGALALGRAIRSHGFWTAIGKSVAASWDNRFADKSKGRCVSACAYAFLGGTTRTAASGELGVHQFHDPTALAIADPTFTAQDLAAEQELLTETLDYVEKMGVSSRFQIAAGRTPSKDLYFFTDPELSEFAITIDPETVSQWKLSSRGGGLLLAATAPDGNHSVLFYCVEPARAPLIVVQYNNLEPDLVKDMKRVYPDIIGSVETFKQDLPQNTRTSGDGPDFLITTSDNNVLLRIGASKNYFFPSNNMVSIITVLNNIDIETLRKVGGRVDFTIDTFHAARSAYDMNVVFQKEFDNDIGVVQKNCLSK